MRWFILFPAVMAVSGAPHALDAQVNSDPPPTCAQIAASARAQSVAMPQARAVASLPHCPRELGEILPTLWRYPNVSSEVMAEVRSASIEVNDRRIFTAATLAAENPTLPVERRLMALEVLAHYIDPATGIKLEELRQPPVQWHPSAVVDAGQRRGEQAMTATEAEQGLVVLHRLSVQGSPNEVRRAARYLRYGFALNNADATPLTPGAITGTWDCNGKLSLRSTADITLTVGIADSTGTVFMGAQIFAPDAVIPPGYPTRQQPGQYEARISKRGPLTVRFGERTLLTLNCP